MEGVWVVGQQNADIADTLHLRDIAMDTTFWLSMGYNLGCMIASDTLFDSRSGFSGSSCPMKTQPIWGSKGRQNQDGGWVNVSSGTGSSR